MPVVSKGEFTVSRLDDGVSSHLHVGWLMADGTFTDTYPGDNLLDTSLTLNNSSDTIFDGWKNGTSTVEKSSGIMHVIVAPEVSQTGYSIHYKGSRLLKNTKYFFSIDAKGSGNLRITYRIQNTAGEWAQNWTEMMSPAALTADYSRYVGSFTTPNWDMRDVQVAFYPQGGGTEAWQTKPKLEISKSATIYTPAPSEDYTLAYPKYRGEYTDTIEADSTNPDDYTWTAYLSERGPIGKQGNQGDSAYQVWLNQGNTGTESDFLNSFKVGYTKEESDQKYATKTSVLPAATDAEAITGAATNKLITPKNLQTFYEDRQKISVARFGLSDLDPTSVEKFSESSWRYRRTGNQVEFFGRFNFKVAGDSFSTVHTLPVGFRLSADFDDTSWNVPLSAAKFSSLSTYLAAGFVERMGTNFLKVASTTTGNVYFYGRWYTDDPFPLG